MPLRRLIAEETISAETAKVMHAAYDAVLAFAAENKITVSNEAIARKVFDAVQGGEQDATRIAATIIKTLRSKKKS